MTTTFTMDEPTSAQDVLETPELLEMILDNLPPLQILVLQRVNATWNSVISNSPAIQRTLFMRPDWLLPAKSFDAWKPANRPGERPKNNRMLRRVLDGMYPTATLKVTHNDDEKADDDALSDADSAVDIPSSTFELPTGPRLQRRSSSGHWSWDVNITYPADRLPSSDPAVLYEHASWRKMFLCQPPCKSLHLVRRWQRASKPAMECETGITMAVFMDHASRAKEAWNQLFIASDRDWHFEGAIQCSSVEERRISECNREVVYDQYVVERLFGTGYLGNAY